MKAVILAAGKGFRMGSKFGEKPKCLIKILGLTLIERLLYEFKECGIQEVIIVIGYKGNLIEEKVQSLNLKDIDITFVINNNWEQGNKSSLRAALDYIKEDEYFLLVMSDHIYDPQLLKDATNKLKEKQITIFCSAEKENNNFEEASRVQVIEDKVIAVGKEIKSDLIDCGIMVLRKDIANIIDKGLLKGEVSEAITLYAKNTDIKVSKFDKYYWHDIDTYIDYQLAKKKILKSLITKRDGLISRKLNRLVSLRITGLISNYKIKPTIISILSFLLGIVSAILFITGKTIWGGIAAQLSSITDGVDGEIARAKFLRSKYGSYIESILDRYADAAIIMGMAFYSLRSEGYEAVLVVALIALLGSVMSMITKEKFQSEYGIPYNSVYDGWIQYIPASRDGRLFVVFLGGLLDQVFIALIILAILSNFQALYRAMYIVKKIRV